MVSGATAAGVLSGQPEQLVRETGHTAKRPGVSSLKKGERPNMVRRQWPQFFMMRRAINFDLLPEEQAAVLAWLVSDRTFTMDVGPRKLFEALTKVAQSPDQRRITIRFEVQQALELAGLISDRMLGALAPGSHTHRALGYIRGMVRHQLAKEGHNAV